MSDPLDLKATEKTEEIIKADLAAKNDSFGNDNKKSPWFLFAIIQIPILFIMVIILYFIYQQRQGG